MKTPTEDANEETDETRRQRVERILSVLHLEDLGAGRRTRLDPVKHPGSAAQSAMGSERSSLPLPSETVVEVIDLPFVADRWGPDIARNVKFADGSWGVQMWNRDARKWQRPPGQYPHFSDAMICPQAPSGYLWEAGIPLEDWCPGQVAELPIRNERGEWTGGVFDFTNP